MTRLRFVFVAAIACIGLQSIDAHAADEPYVVKFKEGRALLTANKYTEALEKFQESATMKPAAGTFLNMGDCLEQLGRYSSAISAFEQARALAAENKQPDREKEAAERATKLQPLLSTIRVKAPADVTVTVDGGPTENDKPISVDGGPHIVHAEMKCKRPKDIPLTIGNKADAQTVTVDPSSFEADPACAPKPTESAGPSTERILSYVAGGVGVIGLGFGIGFGLSASSQKGDLEDACPGYPSNCNPARRTELDGMYDDASTAATISTVGFIGAVAFIGAGGALYSLSPEWKKQQSTGVAPGRFYF